MAGLLFGRTLNNSPALAEIRDVVPTSWLRIKQRLADAAERKYVLEHSNFVSECERPAAAGELPGSVVSDRDEQRQLLRTLHNLGVVIAHGLARDASEIPPSLQILDPNWLTQAIYRILQNPDLRNANGVFQKADLGRWLDQTRYPPHYHDEVLRLMQDPSIELAVPLGQPGHFLVPQALPPKDIDWDQFLSGQCLSFAYRYDPLPSGLMARFIVRTFAHSKNAGARTRYGVMLDVDGCPVHAGVNEGQNQMTLRAGGDPKKRVAALAYVRNTMQELNHIHGMTPAELVPLPDKPAVTVPYAHLLKLENKNGLDHAFLPPDGDREYTIRELLEGIVQGPEAIPVPPAPQRPEPHRQRVDPWFWFSCIAGVVVAIVGGLTEMFGWAEDIGLDKPRNLWGAAVLLGLATTGLVVIGNPRYIWRRLAVAWVCVATLPYFSGQLLAAVLKRLPPPLSTIGKEISFEIEPNLETKMIWVFVLIALLVADWLSSR